MLFIQDRIAKKWQWIVFALAILCCSDVWGQCGVCTRPALPTCFHRRPLGCCAGEVELWGYADYMYVWRTKRHLPPLVTTNGSEVVFGDDWVGRHGKSGWRGAIGVWLDSKKCWGFAATYFGLSELEDQFKSSEHKFSNLARPFFNVTTLKPDSIPIIAPGLFSGELTAEAKNQVAGADAYFTRRWCCDQHFICDWLAGYTYSRIKDEVRVKTTSTELTGFDILTTDAFDRFDVQNVYQGAVLGINAKYSTRCWTLSALAKLGLCYVRNKIDINGSTTVFHSNGDQEQFAGDLLALPTNIGHHSKSQFAVNPSLELKLLQRLWCRFQISVGYTIYWWNRAVMAGDAIDFNVNPTQFEGGVLSGTAEPKFNFKYTNFWVQGVTTGFTFFF